MSAVRFSGEVTQSRPAHQPCCALTPIACVCYSCIPVENCLPLGMMVTQGRWIIAYLQVKVKDFSVLHKSTWMYNRRGYLDFCKLRTLACYTRDHGFERGTPVVSHSEKTCRAGQTARIPRPSSSVSPSGIGDINLELMHSTTRSKHRATLWTAAKEITRPSLPPLAT